MVGFTDAKVALLEGIMPAFALACRITAAH